MNQCSGTRSASAGCLTRCHTFDLTHKISSLAKHGRSLALQCFSYPIPRSTQPRLGTRYPIYVADLAMPLICSIIASMSQFCHPSTSLPPATRRMDIPVTLIVTPVGATPNPSPVYLTVHDQRTQSLSPSENVSST